MRDKIMADQLSLLEQKQLAPAVSFDGLRKVENLPTDLRKSSEDLFLPPLFPDARPGIQFSSERHPLGAPRPLRKAPFEPLALLNAPPTRHSGNKLSEYYDVRNRYYRPSANSQAALRDPKLRPGPRLADQRRHLGGNALSSPQLRLQAPSSAYVPLRLPSAQRPSALPQLRRDRLTPLAKSPYVRQFQALAPRPAPTPSYAPMTKEDFTLEALHQRKLTLQRLNDKLNGL